MNEKFTSLSDALAAMSDAMSAVAQAIYSVVPVEVAERLVDITQDRQHAAIVAGALWPWAQRPHLPYCYSEPIIEEGE